MTFARLNFRVSERLFSGGFLFVVFVFTVFDLVEDRIEGVSWTHLFTEALMLGFAAAGVIYFWGGMIQLFRQENKELRSKLSFAEVEAQKWRAEAKELLSGLSSQISIQFAQWNLSEAEQDIGFLLLKGLSHKEIANIRNSSEKTVRQQSASLYRKANLEGRAELSAFFLEDLLLPQKS